MDRSRSQKRALIVFVLLVVFLLTMAVWWIVYLAKLTDEKVDIAAELGADPEYVAQLQDQEITRQIMLGSEGVMFLLLTLVGIWLIYRAVAQTERLRSHQENFLMAVTHELKTPLASMGIYLDTLESPKIPPEKKERIVPRMRQDVKRLERLVEDILEAGRFDTTGYVPERQQVDLAQLLGTVADNLVRHNPQVSIELSRDLEVEVCANVDAPVIKRAIGVVLDNAVKYAGDSPPAIRLSLKQTDRDAIICISDDGVGIARSELKLIFDRFYRVGNELTRASQGTGLGLYLCREMIRAHGGTVEARSEGAGQGARFEITLPLDNKS